MPGKWFAYKQDRFFKGGFDFATFGEAVAWLREGWSTTQRNAKAMPQYQGQVADFRCDIEGPGGVLPFAEIRRLICG